MNFLLLSLKMISPIETKDVIYYYYCLYLCFDQYDYKDYIHKLFPLKMDKGISSPSITKTKTRHN